MAAGKCRVTSGRSSSFPYPLSDDYTRGPTRCPYPLSHDYKNGVPHTTRYPEDMTKERKAWYIMPVPGRFLENIGTHIFFKKGTTHHRQLNGL